MSSLEDEKVKQAVAMALNRWLFNSPVLTINTSRFFLSSSFPWSIVSDFNLVTTKKEHSVSGIIIFFALFFLSFFSLNRLFLQLIMMVFNLFFIS